MGGDAPRPRPRCSVSSVTGEVAAFMCVIVRVSVFVPGHASYSEFIYCLVDTTYHV